MEASSPAGQMQDSASFAESRCPPQCQGMTFTELASVPSDPLAPFTDQLRLAVAAYLARFKGSSREHTESDPAQLPHLVRRAQLGPAGRPTTSPGAVPSGGCKRSAGSSPPRYPGGSRLRPGSTGPAPSTESWSTRPPSTCAAPWCPLSHPRSASPTCSSKRCSPPPGNHRTRATSRWWPCSGYSACGSSRPPARTSPTSAKNTATGCCGSAATRFGIHRAWCG